MIQALSVHWHYLWLVTASLLAGIMNAMAGGGTFLAFPALLGMGIPPIEANATNTVALWPGQLTSLATLHGDVRRSLLPAALTSALLGGTAGAELLLHTRQITFLHLVPWLLLVAAILFGISAPVSTWLRKRAAKSSQDALGPSRPRPLAVGLLLLPICFYIGYFGAGGGLLIMTVLSLLGLEQMHQLTAMKIVTAATANFCAIVTFVASGRVLWHYCLVSMVFAGMGGYIGARNARRMNPAALRVVVVLTGLTLSAYFFWKQT